MFRRPFLRAGIILAVVATCFAPLSRAQYPGYITSSNDTGMPNYGSYISSNIDSVNLTNGNLIIRIPVFALDGRGVGFKSWYEYDSKFWAVSTTVITHYEQEPVTHFSWHVDTSTGGWRNLSNLGGGIGWTEQTYNCPAWPESYSTPGKTTVRSNYYYSSQDGSRHPVPLINVFQTVPGAVCEPGSATNPYPNLVAYTDSGHTKVDISLDQLLDHTHITIVRQDGTQDGGPNTAFLHKDTNGNFCCGYGTNSSGNWYYLDTLGRPTSDGNGNYYDSNGNLHPAPITGGFLSLGLRPSFPTTSYDDQHIVDPYNGRHMSTITTLTLPNGLNYTFSYDDPNNPGTQNPYGELTKITLPTGGYIKYKFATYAQFDPGPTDPLDGTVYNLDSRRVVQRIVSADGTAASEKVWSYAYTAVSTTVTDPLGNYEVHSVGPEYGCAGSSFNAYAPAPNIDGGASYYDATGNLLKTVATNFQCDGGPIYAAQPGKNIPSISSYTVGLRNIRPISTTITLGDTNQVSETDTVYADCFNYFFTTDDMQRTDCRDNPTQTLEYDYGIGSKGALLRSTSYTYQHNSNSAYLNANITNRVTQKTVFDGNGNQMAATQYAYDTTTITSTNNAVPQHDYSNYSSSNAVRGNVTSVSRWLSATNSWLTTTNYYNDVGNLIQTTDPGGHTYYLSYADNFTDASKNGNTQGFLTSVTGPTTNGVSHIEGKQYFYYTGLAAAVCGQNAPNPTACSNTLSPTQSAPVADYAKYTYDLLGRPLAVTHGDGGTTAFTFSDLTSTATPITISSSSAIDSNNTLANTAMLDGLGRVIQTQLTSDPDGADFVDTVYDEVGRVSTASNPHRSVSAPTDGITTSIYDGLGRTVKVIPPDGSPSANYVTTSYSGNCITTTDQAGKSRKSCHDGLGRLIQVLEDPSSSNYETDYTYDALNNLICVEQHGTATGQTGCSSAPSNDSSSAWRIRRFIYDSLSRMVSSSNPESGTSTFTYDSDGNVLTKTSPKPNQIGAATVTTTITYDALHRVLTKSFNDGSTPTATLAYDGTAISGCSPTLTSADPIGRRTSMCDAAGWEAWSYDSRGHAITERRNTNSVTKSTAYTYNFHGGVTSITYPSGRTVSYTYNAVGQTGSASDVANSITYASNAHYTPAGALASLQESGSNLGSSFYYNNRLQPCRISVKSSGNAPGSCSDLTNVGNVMDFTYGFNSGSADNGNVASITNNINTARSQTYTYDGLNRVITAQTTSTSGTYSWGLSFTYDPWANLLSASVTQGTGYSFSVYADGSNRIHDTPGTFTYDAAGNLTSDPVNSSYAYNAEGELTSAAGVTYAYDGDGNRVQKSNGKLYWYGNTTDPLAESDASGNLTNEYIFLGGARIAMLQLSSSTVNYYVADHLGSSRIVTNSSGTVMDDSDFYPFGGERPYSSSSGNNYKFTGKERDTESGLDDFAARFYTSNYGRFLSPDDSKYVKSFDPQTWNLYGYVANNPINSIDPTGHSPEPSPYAHGWQKPMESGGGPTDAYGETADLEGKGPGSLGDVAASDDSDGRSGNPQQKPPPTKMGTPAAQPYDTRTEAALAAEKAALDLTDKDKRVHEFGGWILKNSDGKFTYTIPIANADPGHFFPDAVSAPKGFMKVADFHTHSFSDPIEGQGFSARDEQNSYDHHRTSFVADTYSRNVYRFVPGVTKYKESDWCCGTIGDFVKHIPK